jgi:hypothetical protein
LLGKGKDDYFSEFCSSESGDLVTMFSLYFWLEALNLQIHVPPNGSSEAGK